MLIFYDPDTLKIMGASTEEVTLNYPYLIVEEDYFLLENLAVKMIDGELKVVYEDPAWYNSNENTIQPDPTFQPAVDVPDDSQQ